MTIQDAPPAIAISGDIDLSSADELFRLEERLFGRQSIVLDVTELKHVDSTFLRFLVKLKARDQSTTVKLVGVKPQLRRILEITGLSRTFVLT